jgi:hypothetical protein
MRHYGHDCSMSEGTLSVVPNNITRMLDRVAGSARITTNGSPKFWYSTIGAKTNTAANKSPIPRSRKLSLMLWICSVGDPAPAGFADSGLPKNAGRAASL